MPSHSSDQPCPAPLAIGGVGGSGTRLIAALLRDAGYALGQDLNESCDNLAFTLVFKRVELWPPEGHRAELREAIRIFRNSLYYQQPLSASDASYVRQLAERDRPDHCSSWLQLRAARLLADAARRPRPRLWGWKEPNTHIFLPALVAHIPGLQYIHVVRHGLDMAFSSNQHQAMLWGDRLGNSGEGRPGPAGSFRYWCAAHRRVLAVGQDMGRNFLMLNFDSFCLEPGPQLDRLLEFVGLEISRELRARLLAQIQPPASLGRYRDQPRLRLAPEELTLLHRLGFQGY